MRNFNFDEQALVGKLIANSADPIACFPIKILESVFQDSKVTFHADELAYFNFYVNEGKEESVKESTKRIYNKILEAINLMDYLKDEGLVTELVSSRERKSVFGEDVAYVSAGLVEVRVYVEEDLIVQKLVDFMSNSVYVSNALKELQNDGFKTFEDKLLADTKVLGKKIRNVMLVALLGVLVGAAGVFFTMQGAQKPAGDCPVKEGMAAIQASIDEKLVPAITEVKTEVTAVKEAVNNMDAEPVSLSDLQKVSSEAAPKADKKKSKKRKH